MTLTDVSETTVPITFNKHPQDALVIRNFEEFNSPVRLRRVFLDSAIKGIMENINAAVTAKFTTGNFTTNSAISATSHIITVAQFLSGLAVLSDQRVNTDDPENMSLLVASTPYAAILGDSNWTNAQIAGNTRAEAIRRSGSFPTSYGAEIRLEPQMPVSGTAPTRTFTAAYLHRYAVALAARPLPAPETDLVEVSYYDFAGIPLMVSLSYSHYPKQGYILSVEAGYGLAVVRENMGQLYSVAE
jgi:hypothetical protein